MSIIGGAPAYTLNGIVEKVSTTLLGDQEYKNGLTAHCLSSEGNRVQVMMKSQETAPAVSGTTVAMPSLTLIAGKASGTYSIRLSFRVTPKGGKTQVKYIDLPLT